MREGGRQPSFVCRVCRCALCMTVTAPSRMRHATSHCHCYTTQCTSANKHRDRNAWNEVACLSVSPTSGHAYSTITTRTLTTLLLQWPGRWHCSLDLYCPVHLRIRQAHIFGHRLSHDPSDRALRARPSIAQRRCLDPQGPVYCCRARRDALQQRTARPLARSNRTCRPTDQSAQAARTLSRARLGYLRKSRAGAPDHIQCAVLARNVGTNASSSTRSLGLRHVTKTEKTRCGSGRADIDNV